MKEQNFRHSGKSVLVIGAGGGGESIGVATAHAFGVEGAHVVLADISAKAGAEALAALASDGIEARFRQADATCEQDVAALVAHTVAEFGRLDIAINNVGGLAPGESPRDDFHLSSLEHWRRAVDINLTSCFLGMKHQITQMLSQGGGVIANTASMAGVRVSFESTGSYAAAKAGVVHLSEHVAVRYADRNIRVNVVAPGLTATPKVTGAMPPDMIADMVRRTHPMGRTMKASEIAAAFAWVCSDEASGVTGLTIPVAGGWAAA